MILRMIESVWGSLRTPAARRAWAQGQQKRNAAGDQLFRAWLIQSGIPEDVAEKSLAGRTKKEAIAWLQHEDRRAWIEYYNLQEEVNRAFAQKTNAKK